VIKDELEDLVFKVDNKKEMEWKLFSSYSFFSEFEFSGLDSGTIPIECQSAFSCISAT